MQRPSLPSDPRHRPLDIRELTHIAKEPISIGKVQRRDVAEIWHKIILRPGGNAVDVPRAVRIDDLVAILGVSKVTI